MTKRKVVQPDLIDRLLADYRKHRGYPRFCVIGGFGVTIGTRQKSTDQQGFTRTAAASTAGSTQGDRVILHF